MKITNPKKLTLKAAKILAIQELGTAAGLVAHENNNISYQRYEMPLGKYNAVITNDCGLWNMTTLYINNGGHKRYFDTDTLIENDNIADHERQLERYECVKEMIVCQSDYVFEQLAREYGVDYCTQKIKEAEKRRANSVTQDSSM